ncbi:hypothetical protein CEUSTIGMA_g10216.t1 [Chlamydomonas eustigma]|uniref:Uncharacterized protein n=1 Tax=Chlamydomonas eustigma TaxID=1157962 RepID=A0A250XJ17_9CHLO|nr:hypothetical protein CEUSTIGMA_g10216.t1 [Chlamydomonas eustigma]|eukprot:GAX82790.1 hypothetical protein CEUSTIGMA_g10216.t1 [Chlamydomonas eustigma]
MLKDSSKGGRSQQYYAGKMRSPQFSTMSSQSKLGSSLESSTRVTNTSTAMGTGAAFAIAPSASGRQLTSEIGMSGSTVMIFGFDAPSIRPEEINFSTPETDEDGWPSFSELQCTSGTYHLASAGPVRDGGGSEAPKPRPSTIAENDSHEDVSVRMAALAHPESTSEQQQQKIDPKSKSKVRLNVKVNGEIICQDSTLGDTSNDSSSSPLHRHLENPRSTVSADDHRGLPKQMPGSPLTPTSCSDAREPVPSRKASLLTAQLASPSNSIDFSQLSPVHRKPSSFSSLNTSQVAASLSSRIKGSGGGGDGEGAAAAAAPQGTSERRLPRPTKAIASATVRTSALREMLLKQQEVAPHGYVFDSATGVWIQAPSPAAYADTQAGHLLSTLRQVTVSLVKWLVKRLVKRLVKCVELLRPDRLCR